jgi:hypothetical protein
LLKLVVPLFDVGDSVDEGQERCKTTGTSNASSAHNTAVGDAFTGGHCEHSHVIAVLVVSEQTTCVNIGERIWLQGASALPVAAS